jgi:hypothetical protein
MALGLDARRQKTRRRRFERLLASCGLWLWRGRGRECLKFFAGFETHCLARRDTNLLSRARVAANSCFARLHVEYSETPKLYAFPAAESVFHRLENGFHGLFGSRASNIRLLNNGVNDVELDHDSLQ